MEKADVNILLVERDGLTKLTNSNVEFWISSLIILLARRGYTMHLSVELVPQGLGVCCLSCQLRRTMLYLIQHLTKYVLQGKLQESFPRCNSTEQLHFVWPTLSKSCNSKYPDFRMILLDSR